jgi:hypothetical protein
MFIHVLIQAEKTVIQKKAENNYDTVSPNSVCKWGRLLDGATKKTMHFKLTLLDGTHCLNISESTISISYTFH